MSDALIETREEFSLIQIEDADVIVFERETIEILSEGIQGPAGADGLMSSHLHTQSVAAAEWIVNHNFGYKPDVSIYDNGGNEVEAQVLHMSDNQVRIYFAAANAGFARCI